MLFFFTSISVSETWRGGVPKNVFRLYGRNTQGNPVVIQFFDFLLYFFVAFSSQKTKEELESFVREAQAEYGRVADDAPLFWERERAEKAASTAISLDFIHKTRVFPFMEHAEHMYRFTLSHAAAVRPLSKSMEEKWGEDVAFFENNVDGEARFLVDYGLRVNAWVEIPSATPDPNATSDFSGSVRAFRASAGTSTPRLLSDEEVRKAALVRRFVIASFDIECTFEEGTFPKPETPYDDIISIAVDVVDLRTGVSASPALQEENASAVLFALGSIDEPYLRQRAGPEAKIVVRTFRRPGDLLLAFAAFLRKLTPDVITSYNGYGFDWPYIIKRAKFLKLGPEATCFGWAEDVQSRNKVSQKSTKAYGAREETEVVIEGVVPFDAMGPIQKNYKLRNYKLDYVAQHFLKERKEQDVKYSEIDTLYRGSGQDRARLLFYCFKDALLPRRLLFDRDIITQYFEIAGISRVPVQYLIFKGEQIKGFVQLLYAARQVGFVVNAPSLANQEEQRRAADEMKKTKGYTGATVLCPKPGFYEEPVAVLDFASLYPSIMIANNFCPSTYVPPAQRSEHAFDDLFMTAANETFVKSDKRAGLIPSVLTELWRARSATKKMMAAAEAEGDTERAKILDGRQLGMKLSMNSLYGFFGAAVGRLPCKAIASSVTAEGRKLIDTTKEIIEREAEPAEVIYGDTDSVFIRWGVPLSITESLNLGEKFAARVNQFFPAPISLELEKALCPLLFFQDDEGQGVKKRYVGLYYTRKPGTKVANDKPDFLLTKGVETTRRDNCAMLPRILTNIINVLMYEKAPEIAVTIAQQAVEAIVRGSVRTETLLEKLAEIDAAIAPHYAAHYAAGGHIHDLDLDFLEEEEGAHAAREVLRSHVTRDDFVLSKQFSRPLEEYVDVMAHTKVIIEMRKAAEEGNDPVAAGLSFHLGDRIDYIIGAPSATVQEEILIEEELTRDQAKKLLAGANKSEVVRSKDNQGQTRFLRRRFVRRTADRAFNPEWAEHNGIEPDAVFYVEQVVNSASRFLSPFLGSKQIAVRKILENVKRKVNSRNGFAASRFALEIRQAIGFSAAKRPTISMDPRAAKVAKLGSIADFAKPGIRPQDLERRDESKPKPKAKPKPKPKTKAKAKVKIGPLDFFFPRKT